MTQPPDPDFDPLADRPPDDGVMLEAVYDRTPVLVALGAVLISLGAVVLSIIALVD